MQPVPRAHTSTDATRLATCALRGGDEDAFIALVEECHPIMLRIACSVTQDLASAQELVRGAWLDVMAELDGFTGSTTLRAWTVRRVVSRAGRDGWPGPVSWPAARSTRGQVALPGRWDRPTGDAGARLRRAIEALPVAERTVVSLRDVAGWSLGETAAALGLTRGEALALLRRARTALTSTLAGRARAARPYPVAERSCEPLRA